MGMNIEEAIRICERFTRENGEHDGRLYEAIEEIIRECKKYEMYKDIIEDIERFCNIGGIE